jgi:hypothetical protein
VDIERLLYLVPYIYTYLSHSDYRYPALRESECVNQTTSQKSPLDKNKKLQYVVPHCQLRFCFSFLTTSRSMGLYSGWQCPDSFVLRCLECCLALIAVGDFTVLHKSTTHFLEFWVMPERDVMKKRAYPIPFKSI